MFRRGGHLFRRHYYRGPGGGVFFYDDDVPANEEAAAAPQAAADLPTCPEDSDDCQGFNDPAADDAPPAIDTLALARSQAMQFLSSRIQAIGWRENGIVAEHDNDDQEVIEPYQGWRVTVEKRKLAFVDFGDERLMLHSDKGGFFNLIVGSYDQNKADWDKIVSAVRTLGVRVTPPGPDERNIMSVRSPFSP